MCGYVRIYKEAWQKAQAQPIRTYVRTYVRTCVCTYICDIYKEPPRVYIYKSCICLRKAQGQPVRMHVRTYIRIHARTYGRTYIRRIIRDKYNEAWQNAQAQPMYVLYTRYMRIRTQGGLADSTSSTHVRTYIRTYHTRGICKEAWQTTQAQPMYVRTYVRTHIRGICKEAWQTAQAQPMYVRTYVRTCVHIYNVHTHVVHIGRPGRKHKLNSCTRVRTHVRTYVHTYVRIQGGLEYSIGSTLI